MIDVEIANQQWVLELEEVRLRRAIAMVLVDAGIAQATISLAVVDDPTIRQLNRKYLRHDYATDVLSFPLERGGRSLEGEIVVSAESAAASAARFGWSAHDELLLYVIHGMLHLVGYDDTAPDRQAEMRSRERACLARLGLEYHFDDTTQEALPLGNPQNRGGNTPS